jgi:serine/threonine-protein kinase
MTVRPLLFGACLAMAALAAPQLHAQTPPTTTEAAQRAFDQGMELMKAGRHAEACVKLEESQRLEAGMGTQFRLAQCYEKLGRMASAWKNYDAVATAARDARLRAKDPADKASLQKRETYSQKRADALVAKVARAAIRVPSDVAMLPGLTVKIDGEIVAPSSWGNVPLDKGMHRLVVEAEGKKPYAGQLEIARDGERISAAVPALEDAPLVPEPTPDPEVVVVTRPGDGTIHPLTIAGIAVGVVGLAGMGAGVGVGFAAKSKHEDADPFCDGNVCRTQEAIDTRADALELGNIGTGVFIAGGVVTAAGLGLLIAGLTMGDDEAVETALDVGPTSAKLTLRW